MTHDRCQPAEPEEGVGPFLGAGGDPPVLLEPPERPLRLVAVTVGASVAGARLLAGPGRRDVRRGPRGRVPLPRRVPVVRPVGDNRGRHQPVQQLRHDDRTVPLPRRQRQPDRAARGVAGGVPSRRQSAAAAADPPAGVSYLPLRRAAGGKFDACRCVRIDVPPNCSSVGSGSPRAAANGPRPAHPTRPNSLRRRNRRQTLSQSPDRSGRSRYGTPVSATDGTAFTNCRSSVPGRPRLGISGSSLSHRASVSVWRWRARRALRRAALSQEPDVRPHYLVGGGGKAETEVCTSQSSR